MIEPRFLHAKGELVKEDRLCRRCSYPLRGLRLGGACPECGVPISNSRTASGVDEIISAPVEYLKLLMLSSWLQAAGAVGLFFAMFTAVIAVASAKFGLVVASCALVASMLWITGVWMVTTPRQFGASRQKGLLPEQEWWRQRLVVRVGQACFVVGLLFLVVLLSGVVAAQSAIVNVPAAFGTPATLTSAGLMVLGVGVLFCVVGIVTVPVHCFYLANLSDWADDTTLSAKLRVLPFVFLAVIALTLVLRFSAPLWKSAFLTFLLIPSVVLLIGLIGFFVWQAVTAYVNFANLLTWAVSNSITGMERDLRVSKAILKRIEEGKRKLPAERINNR